MNIIGNLKIVAAALNTQEGKQSAKFLGQALANSGSELWSGARDEYNRTHTGPGFDQQIGDTVEKVFTKIGEGAGTGIGKGFEEFQKKFEKEVGTKRANFVANVVDTGINTTAIYANVSSLTSRITDTLKSETAGMNSTEVIMYGGKRALQGAVLFGAAAGIYKGGPLLAQYIYDRALDSITKPKLAQKTRTITWTSQFTDYVKERIYGPDKTNVPIFDKELTEDVAEIIDVTKNIKKNKSYFQNVLLYGPGGTGKTMLAEMIAKESGLNYIMMSGGELAQFIKRKEHVGEFNKLWDAAKRSSMPVVVFIDEAESLCKDRKELDAEHMELLNAFLARTGTEDKQVMIVLATNRIEDIDEAVLNRMTHKIHVKPPALLERIQILWKYITQFFTNKAEREALFPESKVKQIAEKTEGFTGRTLFQIANALYAKKGATKDNKLTPEIVDKVVQRFVVQSQGLEQAKALKAKASLQQKLRKEGGGDEEINTPDSKEKKK